MSLALELGRETTAKFPDSYRAQMLRGTAEANFGYLTDALKSFGRAVELNPRSPEANYNLAMIQFAAGFTDDARATLERAWDQEVSPRCSTLPGVCFI